MRWPWSRERRKLERARAELDEVIRRTPEIDAKVTRLERHSQDNRFAARFRVALGGDPQ